MLARTSAHNESYRGPDTYKIEMSQVISKTSKPPEQPMVKQVLPFNESRFDDCVAFLAARNGRSLNIYEIMKLHVMIDVFHTLARGKPVIGGALWPFTNGPVARHAKHHVRKWWDNYQKNGSQPERLRLVENADGARFEATAAPDEQEFSTSELEAMSSAWNVVIPVLAEPNGFEKSQRYFHSESFIGRAWSRAKASGRELNWDDIIDEYDLENRTDHSHIKTIMRF